MAGEARGIIVDIVINTAVALVTTAILTGTWAIARKRYKLLNQRDASAYAQRPSFAERYTRTSVEDFLRYDRRLYEIVDTATYPANIEWPEVPVPQTIAEFNASLPKAEV